MLEAWVLCMALNIHFEAGTDPLEGQLAVALATLNRAHHKKDRICNEVFRPGQFIWTDELPKGPSKKQMSRYKDTAIVSLSLHDFTGGATHFCHYKSFCSWSVNMEFLGRWGSHNFYKPIPKVKK